MNPRLKLLLNRLRRALLVGGITAALLVLLWQAQLFTQLQLALHDVYFVPAPITDNIVIVALDDASFETYGRSLLDWSRLIYADLINYMGEAGARVVALDILFPESTGNDSALADAILQARQSDARTRIVLSASGVGLAERSTLPDFPAGVRYQQFLDPIPELSEVTTATGIVNVFPDADARIRRQMSIVQVGDQLTLSLPLAVYLAYLRVPEEAYSQVLSYDGEALYVTPDRRIIVDENGVWRQNFFSAAEETAFPIISLVDVLNGQAPPETFAGKIVLVGLMNSTGITDAYSVPASIRGQLMPGIEIQAHAIETIIQNLPPAEISRPIQALLLIGLTLFAAFMYDGFKWYVKLMIAAALCLGWCLLAFMIFSRTLWIVPLFYPLLGLSVPALFSIGIEINTEIQKRLLTESLLNNIQRLSHQLEEQNAMLESILSDSPSGIVVVDSDWRIVRSNEAFRRFSERREVEIVQQTLLQLLHSHHETQWQLLRHKLERGQPFNMDFVIGERTFNLLAVRLPEFNLWVILLNDITSLTELSQLKTRMIRMASHDLKNPLSSISMSAELMEMDANLSPKNQNYVQMILRSSNEMDRIIQDILDLERARSNASTRLKINLTELVREAAERHILDLQKKQQELTLEIPDKALYILGDRGQLSQAIGNLVSNACKYTPDSGSISVQLTATDGIARLIVQDTGYGIPTESLPKLFTEFYRAKTTATAHIPGTGLGLSLVKTVIETHEGKIWVDSQEGSGSTFTVELPAFPL
jgi:PAS domain S-box-containing protein